MKPLIGIPTYTHMVGESIRYEGIATYTRAIDRAGGAPIFIPLKLDDATLRAIFDRLDGLLMQGGDDVHPKEYGESVESYCGAIDEACDATELGLLRWAFEKKMPVLAVCRGIQVLNVAAGGTLYQDIDTQLATGLRHPHIAGNSSNYLAHPIEVEPQSRLARAVGTTRLAVNSRHHQAVKRVAPGFYVTARAPDGVVEAIESTNGHFALGMQFHPENLIDDDPRIFQVFKDFIEHVRGVRSDR